MEFLEKLLSFNQNYIFYGLLLGLFLLEGIRKSRAEMGSKLKHFFHNFLFQIILIALGSLVVFITVQTFEWIETRQFGIFNWLDTPFWLKITAGVFIIDLADYWFHRWDHRIPLLWRQHRVHHSDTSLDVSTTLRVFPTDLIYFVLGESLFAVVFGLDILSMNIFLFLLLVMMFLQHSSLKFPRWVDGVFGWLLMTPNYHKVHHEQDQQFTDSNYGTVFILWDRLFGTFRYKPVHEINYGLEEFTGEGKQSFWYQIRSPFLNIKRSQ